MQVDKGEHVAGVFTEDSNRCPLWFVWEKFSYGGVTGLMTLNSLGTAYTYLSLDHGSQAILWASQWWLCGPLVDVRTQSNIPKGVHFQIDLVLLSLHSAFPVPDSTPPFSVYKGVAVCKLQTRPALKQFSPPHLWRLIASFSQLYTHTASWWKAMLLHAVFKFAK